MADMQIKNTDITDDYYSMIGCYKNVSLLLKNIDLISKEENDELEKIKEGQKKDILVHLGRTGEMAFKYIIKLKLNELDPNLTYDDFCKKQKGKERSLRFLANKVGATEADIQSILATKGTGPESHDFYYLYSIIEKFFPDIVNRFEEVMKMNLKSNNALDVMKEKELEEYSFVCFPELAFTIREEIKTSQKEIIELLEARNNTIKDNGDIFTRFRYFSENLAGKTCDINEIYELISDIVLFIELINLNNDELDFDPEFVYSKYKIKENKDNFKIRFSMEEINKLYSNEKLDKEAIEVLIFYNELSFDKIEEILNSNIAEKDYLDIFYNSLDLETILYFKSIGIDSYFQMTKELSVNAKDPLERLMNVVQKKRYTLEEYKELRKKYNLDKYPSIFDLLLYMSFNSLDKLIKDEKLTEFFVSEFAVKTYSYVYKYTDKMFELLLGINELRQNMDLWYSLDSSQLSIYQETSKMFETDSYYDEIISKRNFIENTIIENIKDNIECFKDDKKMLRIMPLMLDNNDIIHIFKVLEEAGLDKNKITDFDTTLLCMPPTIINTIKMVFDKENESLIVNNDINPKVYEVLKKIKDSKKTNVKILTRRYVFDKYNDSETINVYYKKELMNEADAEALEKIKTKMRGIC